MNTILSLCDYSGTWSAPYADAGYEVICIDIKHGFDVRLFESLNSPVKGVLAAPPCTDFSSSGARWWKEKGDQALLDSLAIVDACARIVLVHKPKWWALENPVGRLRRWLGEPKIRFQPCDYGDPYTKKTCLWGQFKVPPFNPVEPVEGSKMWRNHGGRSERTKEARSITPAGFAQAFFEANP